MKNDIHKDELAVKSIKLAQNIEDNKKRNTCTASIFALASKYLNSKGIEKVWEVLEMTDLLTRFIEEKLEERLEEKLEERLEEKLEERLEEKLHDKDIEVAKNALKKGATIEFIADITGLDIENIKKLQVEFDSE